MFSVDGRTPIEGILCGMLLPISLWGGVWEIRTFLVEVISITCKWQDVAW